jgi:ribosomal protein L28
MAGQSPLTAKNSMTGPYTSHSDQLIKKLKLIVNHEKTENELSPNNCKLSFLISADSFNLLRGYSIYTVLIILSQVGSGFLVFISMM